MQFVIKKDGTRVNFKEEKINHAIQSSALEAGVFEDEAQELSQKILEALQNAFLGQEEVKTSELRAVIVSELEVIAPVVLEVWKKYEEGKTI